MKQVQMAGLTVRMAGGVDREGGGDGPVVVLLHGFGAPGDNLVSLWRVLDAPRGTRWVFPAAPLLLQSAPVEARAWWQMDTERLLALAGGREGAELTRQAPVGLREARESVVALLEAIDDRLRPPKLVLGGFSQGAILACDVALRTNRTLAGVALLSGLLVAADEWSALAPLRAGLCVLQSHGRGDALLPFVHAEKLRDLLRAGGVDVTWVPFQGGHEIPNGVVDALSQWLRTVLA